MISRLPRGPVRLRLALFGDTHIEPDADPKPRSNTRAAAVVARINAGGFDRAIHMGDVVHPVPSMASAADAWRVADEILARLEPPLEVIPGNHDIGDKPLAWMPAKAVQADWVQAFEARFGAACRAVDHDGISLVLLNAPVLNSALEAEADQWRGLEALLEERHGQRLFAFLHYPPYLVRADEASHYDNLDEPGRGRLLDRLAAHGCEALFAGHVHHRFYGRHGDIELYTVPATAFTRRDYVETHPLAPEPEHEHGRNLATKLGFLELAIHDHGHATGFRRLEGDVTADRACALGVDLRHPWWEVRALPFNPPTDAFQRRKVRDDRAVLALMDLGIARARVPIDDLLDPPTRERMGHLAERGIRWTVFCLGPPGADLARTIADHAWMIDAVEVIGETGRSLGCPVIQAPLVTSHDSVSGRSNLTQFTGCGLTLDEARNLPPDLPPDVAGYVLQIPWSEPFVETAEQAAALVAARGWTLHVTVGLMSGRPDIAVTDDARIAARVREAAALAGRHPGLRLFIDTFEDIDRGYYVRRGLIDRRGDPTPAGLALVTATTAARP